MILALPAPLRPWESELARLPRELALSIGPHVARLALAIGPLPAIRTGGAGEPDGYGGLGRRGSYERLLMGEWALAELWPEEFERRAAAGEHAFLELARRSAAGARRSVLLLDAGPTQLGGPRIAHLAALVAFARRAAAAGAELRWGVLQRLAGELHAGLDQAGISALLESRSAYEVSPALIEAWIERVAPAADDDLWLIGPPALTAAAAAAGAACLVIEDVVEPGARRIQAQVIRAGRRGPALALPLPAPEDCARLLRDPYGAAVAARAPAAARVEPSSPVRISADGRRVLVLDDVGGFLAWPIPSSPRATPGRMRRFRVPPGRILRAAGTAGKRLVAVTEGPDGDLLAHGVGGRTRRLLVAWAGVPGPVFPPDEVPGTCCLTSAASRGQRRSLVVGVAGELWMTAPIEPGDGPIPFAAMEQEQVVAWAVHAGGVTVVHRYQDGYRLRLIHEGLARTVSLPPRQDAPAAFIGHDPRAYPTAAPIATRFAGEQWHVLRTDGGSVERSPPPGMTVIGVAEHDDLVGLLVLDRLERTIGLAVPGRVIELHRSSGQIASICASSARGQVAYLTAGGELVVLSPGRRSAVLRVQLEAAE